MTEIGLFQILIYLAVLLALVKPLGAYMTKIYNGKPWGLEKLFYNICAIQPDHEMDWKEYLIAMLVFNFIGFLFVYLLFRLQAYLPLNPEQFAAVSPALSFNTAISFATNTNWQAYGGESTLGYLAQMAGLTVQNFLSAATGMSLLIAFIRGLVRSESKKLGNFWVDVVRSVLYILLPLAAIFAVFLVSQGVIQNFNHYQDINLTQPYAYQQHEITQQTLPMGPVASQIAIKQLGTNGGGFFNTNSAYPFENPTALSNFFEMLALLLIPTAFCYTFGVMVKDKRQGWAILLAMLFIFIPLMCTDVAAEQSGNPIINTMGIEQHGNMEGKETRFGITSSALWASATTATANGSVNSMLDSYTPIGGLIPLWFMHLGEVVFGGVGSGLYGMLMLVIIAVFVAGLMVGRTPEYLGKKIEPFEMKMASIAVLIMPMIVLIFTMIAVSIQSGTAAIANPGAHGFSEILYAFTSMTNNNGSSFSGLNANINFYNILGGIVMLIGRYWIAIPMLAIAGSLVQKKIIPTTAGTLQTHTPLFVILLIGVTIILGALTFFPALSLGPIVEHIMLWEHYGN